MGTSSFLTAKLAFEVHKQTTSFSNRNRKPKKNIIILDWDDTLMCTSFLMEIKFNPSPEEKEHISFLGKTVNAFVSLCKRNGDVFLVTNSASDWVYSSINLYFNQDKDILDNIEIYANRDKYLHLPISQWKEKAFGDLEPIIKKSTNLLCIGDSDPDVDEGKKIQMKYSDVYVTTIKLRKQPSVQTMIDQLNYLMTNFSKLFKYTVHVNIQNENEMKQLIRSE